MLVLKLKAARDRTRARNGRCEGPQLYGTTQEEAKILKRVRYMRRKPKGHTRPSTFQSIADQLNAEGIHTRTGKTWTASLV